MIVSELLYGGRHLAVRLAGWLAGQDKALTNARRASTAASQRRVERDEVAIYLDALEDSEEPVSTQGAADQARTGG